MKQIKPRDKAFLVSIELKEGYIYKLVVFASTDQRAGMKASDAVDGELKSIEQVRFVI